MNNEKDELANTVTQPDVATAQQPEYKAPTDEVSTSRLEAFSDGVFAIAITLLILEIHLPDFGNLPKGLLDYLSTLWPVYLAYLISFGTIGILWINHHIVFKYVNRSNRTLLNLNLLLLLVISFIPFPTGLLGEAIKANITGQGSTANVTVAAAVYSGTLLAMSLAFNLLWTYVSRRHRLVDERVPEALLKTRERASMLGGAFYAVAFIVAFFNVGVSIAITLLVAAIFFLPSPSDRF